MKIAINKIKPDPNQPRRTFNEEKMKALEASIKADGFRLQYPIIINGGNIIVDGERRWRAAKKVGLKEVPVEKKENISDWERLLYQLQSEGAELEPSDRLEAWFNLHQKSKKSLVFLAAKLGVSEDSFGTSIRDFQSYLDALSSLSKSEKFSDLQEPKRFWPLTVLGKEKDTQLREKLVEKAIKEDWTTDKARDIRQAIKESPVKIKQILSQDYSDPYEGSQQWKSRLEVAKSDIDIEDLEDRNKTLDYMQEQLEAFDVIVMHGLRMKAAMDKFDFEGITPMARAKLHKNLTNVLPFAIDFIQKLESFMLENGEITNNDIKRLNG